MTMTLHNPYYHDYKAVYGCYPMPVYGKKIKGKKQPYCPGIYNLKAPIMSPKNFGLSQAGRKCHNSKNKKRN